MHEIPRCTRYRDTYMYLYVSSPIREHFVRVLAERRLEGIRIPRSRVSVARDPAPGCWVPGCRVSGAGCGVPDEWTKTRLYALQYYSNV